MSALAVGVPYATIVVAICRQHGWPTPDTEVRFAPPRRWRFDFAWPAQKVAVEINGGLYTAGRHSRGAGQIKDFEKLNAAQIQGWKVLQVTPRQVTDGTLTGLLANVLPRAAGKGQPRREWETSR